MIFSFFPSQTDNRPCTPLLTASLALADSLARSYWLPCSLLPTFLLTFAHCLAILSVFDCIFLLSSEACFKGKESCHKSLILTVFDICDFSCCTHMCKLNFWNNFATSRFHFMWNAILNFFLMMDYALAWDLVWLNRNREPLTVQCTSSWTCCLLEQPLSTTPSKTRHLGRSLCEERAEATFFFNVS